MLKKVVNATLRRFNGLDETDTWQGRLLRRQVLIGSRTGVPWCMYVLPWLHHAFQVYIIMFGCFFQMHFMNLQQINRGENVFLSLLCELFYVWGGGGEGGNIFAVFKREICVWSHLSTPMRATRVVCSLKTAK